MTGLFAPETFRKSHINLVCSQLYQSPKMVPPERFELPSQTYKVRAKTNSATRALFFLTIILILQNGSKIPLPDVASLASGFIITIILILLNAVNLFLRCYYQTHAFCSFREPRRCMKSISGPKHSFSDCPMKYCINSSVYLFGEMFHI